MSIPPSSRSGSNNVPSGKGKPDEGKKTGKDFKLPKKELQKKKPHDDLIEKELLEQELLGKEMGKEAMKGPMAGEPRVKLPTQEPLRTPFRQTRMQPPSGRESERQEDDKKKKGIFDIAAEDKSLQEKQSALQEGVQASEKAEGISASASIAEVNQVSELIQRLVESMHIGEVGGKDFASLELKSSAEVPVAFAGSQLNIAYEANGIAIHFDNFMSVQQQNAAIALVEQNKEQLQQMIVALNARNIQVAELSIGSHMVALPRVAPLPPPFQAPTASQAESEQRERGGGGGGRGEEEGGEGEEGGPR